MKPATEPLSEPEHLGAPSLRLVDVTKAFPATGDSEGTVALEHLSMDIAAGEVVALIGPSGCGKSTTLGLFAGLFPATSGSVQVEGVEVTGPSASITYMLQKDLLLPWRTVQRNVEFAMELRGVKPGPRRERATQLLDSFGLGGFANSYPAQLSGGMRQRAALARTVALDPRVLILDEPFSALDYQTKLVLQQEVHDVIRAHGCTTLLVTHDLVEATLLADRVLVMSQRPGRIKASIDIELVRDRPLLELRNDPLVNRYFSEIWDELDATL